MPPNVRVYVCQILINFQHSFTGALYGQFAIKLLLQTLPHPKRVATLFCEILIFKNCTNRSRATANKEHITYKENVTVIDALVLSQYKTMPQIYHSIQADVILIILWRCWFEEGRMLKNRLKHTVMRDKAAQNGC